MIGAVSAPNATAGPVIDVSPSTLATVSPSTLATPCFFMLGAFLTYIGYDGSQHGFLHGEPPDSCEYWQR